MNKFVPLMALLVLGTVAVEAAQYSWVTGSYSSCSYSCGPNGIRTRSVDCMDENGNIVNALSCVNLEKPVSSTPCINNPVCSNPTWTYSAFGACNLQCVNPGQISVRTRTISCTNDGATVDPSNCGTQSTQSLSENCVVPACTQYSYTPSAWGACSIPCGGTGLQTRTVPCTSSLGQTVSSTFCSNFTTPITQQVCNNGDCKWSVGSWSSCSTPCGVGAVTRSVTCTDQFGAPATDRCRNLEKPADSMPCNKQCGWKVASISCSQQCGGGKVTPTFGCFPDTCGENCPAGEQIADSYCEAVQTKPTLSSGQTPLALCNTAPCAPRWVTTTGTCSKACGGGEAVVTATCRTVDGTLLADEQCAGLPRPRPTTECNTNACGSWAVYEWYPCTTTVGCVVGSTRTQTRNVQCVPFGAVCQAEKPVTSRPCTVTYCVVNP